jgi:hypothetical protein
MADASARMREAMTVYFRFHKAAHGATKIRPKHHWAFDVADQLASDTVVFDAFVIERLHLRVRPLADNVKRLDTWERSVLGGVLNSHIRSANNANCKVLGGGLVGKSATHHLLPGSTLADNLELGGFRAAVGDVVCSSDSAGTVVACSVFEGELWLIVDAWQLARKISAHSGEWRTDKPERQAWRAAEAEECVAWKVDHFDATVIRL